MNTYTVTLEVAVLRIDPMKNYTKFIVNGVQWIISATEFLSLVTGYRSGL